MDDNFDVAIVGCGPVGMVLASLLADAGLNVIALERQAELGHRPRARHLDAEAIRVLQTIGVADACEEMMEPFPGLRLVDASGQTLMEHRVDVSRPGAQGWIADYQMYQPALLRILFDHLIASGRATVLTNHEAED